MGAPPPELAAAIHSSSATYGVPESVLTRVWQVESGSSFPNPYVNSAGYGGLFGTKLWNAPTQTQSDYAASILATGYSKFGSWDDALSYYRTGQPGKGYPGGSVVATRTGPAPASTGNSSIPGIGDIAGAISGLGTQVSAIPGVIAQDTKHLAIGAGFGILGILLIVTGIIVIVKVANEKGVQGAMVSV